MDKYPDFWSIVIGHEPIGIFLGYVFLAYVGAIGMVVVVASTRDKNSLKTPVQWSWKFFWADNALRFVAGFFLIPAFIRMTYEGSDPYWMMLTAFGIGFGFQGLAHLAKGIGLLTTKKLASKFIPKEDDKEKDS